MPMTRSRSTLDEQFWSALNVGVLSLVAAALSVLLFQTSGEWPAGFDGWGAVGFTVAGAALVAVSFTHRLDVGESAGQ